MSPVDHRVVGVLQRQGLDDLLVVPLRPAGLPGGVSQAGGEARAHLREHQLDHQAQAGGVEAHEDEEVHNDGDHGIGGQLFQPTDTCVTGELTVQLN